MHVSLNLDWKFLVTLVATIAGVIVPVWLWQADLASKGLSVSVVSLSEIQTGVTMDGVKVMIDGKTIGSPTIVDLELTNNGTRPIASADFESPLELLVTLPSTILKASPKDMNPAGLMPIISTTAQSIKISPLLLNPKDTFRITALIDGRSPRFSAIARISGVSSVPVVDGVAQKSSIRSTVKAVFSTALLCVYAFAFSVFADSIRRSRPNWWAIVAAVLALIGGITLVESSGKDIASLLTELAPRLLVAVLLTGAIRFPWRRRSGAV